MSHQEKKYPFEAPLAAIDDEIESYVDAVFSCLESEFLVMPKGPDFVEYDVFERAYEELKKTTKGFKELDSAAIVDLVRQYPLCITVLRTMLGFTSPEWAYEATQETGILISQGAARSLERRIRIRPEEPIKIAGKTGERIQALITTACSMLSAEVPRLDEGRIHRLDKADTRRGLASVQALSELGVPYAMLLYERLLGRPFAAHRDSVSELIGGGLEEPIEDLLSNSGVSFRKIKRAERIEGFDQTPDFVIPDEFSPKVVIEAKITEDDGTARDKVTRIQHLAEISMEGRTQDNPKFQVVACIGGRGFGVRREDMRKLIRATRGKVFTLQTLDKMIAYTKLKEYVSRQ
jgi:hypothetical protein